MEIFHVPVILDDHFLIQKLFMRILVPVTWLLLLACNAKKESGEKTNSGTTQTVVQDTLASTVPVAPVFTPSEAETEINSRLTAIPGSRWVVVNDTMAHWPAGEFEYFIAPKRKEHPDYPYITNGDFNGDGLIDQAALVKITGSEVYLIAILLKNGPVLFWSEDIDLCALSTYPKGPLEGMEGGKKNLTGDGINVEFYERATFVLYWNGKTFKRSYTGD